MPSVHIILPSLSTGGAEKVALLLAHEFKNNGFEVHFIVRNNKAGGYTDEVLKHFQLTDLKAGRVRHFPARLFQFYRRQDHPDIVLANLWPLTALSTFVLRLARVKSKIACIEHGSLRYQVSKKSRWHHLILRNSLKWSMRFTDKMVGVSEGLKQELSDLSGYTGPKLIHIPNPIELPVPHQVLAANIQQRLANLTDHTFLFVGRLKRVKNVPLLLEAFQRVLQRTKAELIIAGDGAERNQLEDLARQLQINHHVHFLGFVDPCGPLYQHANTFVLSSDSEGFGNVLVEALMMGRTVVSTDCPYGPQEILDRDQFGYLSPVGDAEGLAQAMLQAMDEPIDPAKAKARGLSYAPSAIFKQYQQALS